MIAHPCLAPAPSSFPGPITAQLDPMDCAVNPRAEGNRPERLRASHGFTPLLPNEPSILFPDTQAALTARYLLPVLPALETYLLAVRRQLDPELQRLQPMKLDKPYPLGQCLEIATAVQQRLRTVTEAHLPADAVIGLRALRAFQRAGGTLRLVWGDLRGQYFQNAFQIGTLYVDVANDTVTPTKPKVEILPFDQAQFIPIRDFQHFSQIARAYWGDEIYPNHVLPRLAPHCPLIHVTGKGRIMLHVATQYMLALTRSQGFAPSEAVLREAAMPPAVFEQACRAFQDAGHTLPKSPEHGRTLALQQCRQQQAKRWHLDPRRPNQVIQDANLVNLHLTRWHHQHIHQEKPMPTIKIDNIEYDTDKLSQEARQQLDMVVAAEGKLRELQRDLAITQTARNAYLQALKAHLPSPLETALAQGDVLKLS